MNATSRSELAELAETDAVYSREYYSSQVLKYYA